MGSHRAQNHGFNAATGCCASTPADRTGWSMGSHRAHPRSSTPMITGNTPVVEAGPVPAVEHSCIPKDRCHPLPNWRRSGRGSRYPARRILGQTLAPRDQRTEWAYIFGAKSLVRHRRHGGAPHRDQCRRLLPGGSRRPCGAERSGRLALGTTTSLLNHGWLSMHPRLRPSRKIRTPAVGTSDGCAQNGRLRYARVSTIDQFRWMRSKRPAAKSLRFTPRPAAT